MARKFLTSIDLDKNQLQNAAIHTASQAPSNPVEGQVYVNTTDSPHTLNIYLGSAWTTWITTTEFETKRQLVDAKDSVKVATTQNITLSGEQTIDGVAIVAGDRVLVKNQSAIAEVSTVNFTDATPAGLAGKYFTLNSTTTAYYVWFDLDDGSSDPQVESKTGIAVDIATGDTDAQIAGKAQTVLENHSAFTASLDTKTVTVTNSVAGAVTDITAGDSGLSVGVGTQGKVAGAYNGIYVASASAWSRADDASLWNEHVSAFVFVEQGNTLADSGWLCSVDAGGTLNTTAVTWVQFSQAGTIDGSNVGGGTFGVFKQKSGTTLQFKTISDTGSIDVTDTDDVLTFAVIPGGIDRNSLGGSDPLAVEDGGTGGSTAAAARSNLGATTKYSANVGDGQNTTYTITHSLGTTDVLVQVFATGTPKALVEPDIEIVDNNNVKLIFASAPSNNAYRLIVIG